MADNYLENKMEEHRNHRPRPVAKITPSGRKPGFALLPFDIRTALVTADVVSPVTEVVISELRGTGCRVALLSDDINAAKASQHLSCLHIPASKGMEVAVNILGNIEMTVKVEEDTVTVEIGRGLSTIRRDENTSEENFALRAARLCIYLALPDSVGRVWGDFTI